MISTARRALILALVIPAVSGCFRYNPVELETVPAGENVRVYVNRTVVQNIDSIGLVVNEPILRGRVTRRETENLFLRVPVGTQQIGFHSAEIGQDVQVPLRDIVAIERRRLDPIGTGALVAGAAGAAAVVIFMIMDAFGEREVEEECEECVELLTPLIKIPLR